jgi:hypothetical protein
MQEIGFGLNINSILHVAFRLVDTSGQISFQQNKQDRQCGAVTVAAVGLADSGPSGHVVVGADIFLIRKRIRLRGCSGRGPGGHIFFKRKRI